MNNHMDKILQCPICYETMKEPMVAGCGHSFCKHCWGSLIAQVSEYLLCPLCRHTVLSPAVLNVTLWEVIKEYDTTMIDCSPPPVNNVLRNMYKLKSELYVFPTGYVEHMDTMLSNTCLDGVPVCSCGLVAWKRAVTKKGHNNGKIFWSCPLQKSGCRYFQWG